MTPNWFDWPETKTLVAAFAAQPQSLRFVGGSVRDALLARPVTDVDAATTLLPEEVMALLANAGIKAVPTGIDHGTVTAVISGKHFEITSLRKDTACDGRHADVEFTADWEEDARRRDFTMNALYLSPQGELFDYFGGVDDAKAGWVRFIGDAADRIKEDYLRILRFFRFHAWYGKGEADKAALAACAAGAAGIAGLSGERIQQEMMKLLGAPSPLESLRLMGECGLFPPLFGATIDLKILEALVPIETAQGQKPDARLRLASLISAAQLANVTLHWKLSNEAKNRIRLLLIHPIEKSIPVAEQKKLLRKIGADNFKQSVLLSWAKAPDTKEFKAMLALADAWKAPVFPVGGNDLLALGLPQGEALGNTLRELEEAWEKSDYVLTKEELLARVK